MNQYIYHFLASLDYQHTIVGTVGSTSMDQIEQEEIRQRLERRFRTNFHDVKHVSISFTKIEEVTNDTYYEASKSFY